jgi:hypothetical protein
MGSGSPSHSDTLKTAFEQLSKCVSRALGTQIRLGCALEDSLCGDSLCAPMSIRDQYTEVLRTPAVGGAGRRPCSVMCDLSERSLLAEPARKHASFAEGDH